MRPNGTRIPGKVSDERMIKILLESIEATARGAQDITEEADNLHLYLNEMKCDNDRIRELNRRPPFKLGKKD